MSGTSNEAANSIGVFMPAFCVCVCVCVVCVCVCVVCVCVCVPVCKSVNFSFESSGLKHDVYNNSHGWIPPNGILYGKWLYCMQLIGP